MNRAARLAKANARSIRWLLHAGLLVYGKRIHNNQFFLRRLTTLSLYLFSLISVLAKIDAAQKVGADVSEDLEVLDYLAEEARQARRGNKRLFRSRREALHKKIFEGIVTRLSEPAKA
jgi:acyl-CoA dehydrogenase family protein 9